tara:strand:+ start:354 stop:557 length:204 start_codon:yes stop_codon:yes gene_type:complete
MIAKKSVKINSLTKNTSELNSIRKSLLNLRFQKATGQLEKTSKIRKLRKQIAQILTKINQKKGLDNA